MAPASLRTLLAALPSHELIPTLSSRVIEAAFSSLMSRNPACLRIQLETLEEGLPIRETVQLASPQPRSRATTLPLKGVASRTSVSRLSTLPTAPFTAIRRMEEADWLTPIPTPVPLGVRGVLTAIHDTFSDNTAYPGTGGGILDEGPGMTLIATIVANSGPGLDCDIRGPFIDGGYNLADDSSCHFGGTSLNHVLARLENVPRDNGGPMIIDPEGNPLPTLTLALLPGSAAIGHVTNPSDCLPTDERLYPVTTPCDIGAYESTANPPAATPEVPFAPAFPLVALGGFGGLVLFKRRRRLAGSWSENNRETSDPLGRVEGEHKWT